jgi:4-amino-4-deoxy-L-arabinose transferase-like glycosyltransferase
MAEAQMEMSANLGAELEVSPRLSRVIAAVLLVVLAVLLFASVRQESQTFDEADHLYAGFEYWKHGDFGRNPEHPPLAKLLAAIPILPMGLKEPAAVPIPFFKAVDLIGGQQFLYGANADAILLRGRMVIALFSLGLGLLVFLAAREMFGDVAAIVALSLFVFEPVVLANGALVTTDMPLACLFFASVYAFYRYVKMPSLGRFAVCAVATALAVATKHSGFLVLPTLVMLAVVDLFLDRSEGPLKAKVCLCQLRRLAAALLAIALVSYIFLWTIYGFRFAARPGGLQIIPALADYAAAMPHPWQRAVILFLAHYHVFPQAYLYGWVDILLISSERTTFVFGHLYPSGRWFFFPALFLIKSTLALLILLALVPFARIRERRRELVFLALPVAFYFLIAIVSMLNMGVRHVLPVYPFCLVLAGAAAASFAVRSVGARVAVAALVLFTVVSSLHSFPDFLAYSNEIAGGPSRTYRLVVDSNSDWGQGLKWTKTYLDQHPAQECWIDYNQPAVDPAYYGIRCKLLPSGLGHRVGIVPKSTPSTISGTVFLSATDLSGLHWGPGTLNPYKVFLERRPDDVIGNTVLVYRGTFDVPLLAAQTDAVAASRLLRQGKVADALALAQRAAEEAPDSAEVHSVLARALNASGRTEEAKAAGAETVRLAKAIYPEFQTDLAK